MSGLVFESLGLGDSGLEFRESGFGTRRSGSLRRTCIEARPYRVICLRYFSCLKAVHSQRPASCSRRCVGRHHIPQTCRFTIFAALILSA